MREIKFRLWNPESEKMHFLVSIWNMPDNQYGNFKLMQYTGLKDKTGKEIYDGDIVLIDRFDRVFKVFWVSDNAQYNLIGYPIESDSEILDFWEIKPSSIRIIGNRYENPELLEEDK